MAGREPTALEALAALADEQLIAAAEHRLDPSIAREPRARTFLRPPALHVEPEGWRAGYLSVRERELPPELFDDLAQRTPQATLRDLYRPVRESVWYEREPFVPDWDPGARRALAEAKAAFQIPPVPKVAPIVREVEAEQARRRAFITEPWKPHLDDSEPRPLVEVMLR